MISRPGCNEQIKKIPKEVAKRKTIRKLFLGNDDFDKDEING